MSKAINFITPLLILALVAFGLHFLINSIAKDLPLWDTAYMHLWQIYALQLLMTVIVIFAVVGIGNSLPQHLGYVFLGVLTLKVIATYIIINPALEEGVDNEFFKYNFLIVFFLFMFYDVYVTYRVLNQTYSPKK